MDTDVLFRSARLTGRAPAPDAASIYDAVFGETAKARLALHMRDRDRQRIAPWTLSHAGQDVGVGGFTAVPKTGDLDLSFHFLERVWGLGLASEFVAAAIDHAIADGHQGRVIARVDDGMAASIRVLEKTGFRRGDQPGGMDGGDWAMTLSLGL